MRIPENQIIPSPFFGNYFCLLPGHNAAFVAISKNGVTFLKKLAIFFKTGEIVKDENTVHNIIGYNGQSDYLIPVSEMEKYEKTNGKLLKFAVWRDPIERLISVYKYFCLEREYQRYYQFLDLYHDNSFERFMEFVEFELKKSHPEFQDEHIRKQVDYYRREDVDYVVSIKSLNQFLNEKGIPVIEDKTNTTTAKFDFPSEKWKNKIKELYECDYKIK